MCIATYFFFNDTATAEIYTYGHTLSLHDALPIWLLLAAVALVFAGTATCVINPLVPLPVLLALKLGAAGGVGCAGILFWRHYRVERHRVDRKSTRLNSSH